MLSSTAVKCVRQIIMHVYRHTYYFFTLPKLVMKRRVKLVNSLNICASLSPGILCKERNHSDMCNTFCIQDTCVIIFRNLNID